MSGKRQRTIDNFFDNTDSEKRRRASVENATGTESQHQVCLFCFINRLNRGDKQRHSMALPNIFYGCISFFLIFRIYVSSIIIIIIQATLR